MALKLVLPTEPLDQAVILARQALPLEPTPVETLDAYVFQIFARVLRLADGVVVLIKAHLPEEALFLGRSMFEDSLRMLELTESTQTRYRLLLGWAVGSLQEARGLSRTAVVAGLEKSEESFFPHIEAERQRIERCAARSGVVKPKRFRSVRDAAAAFGRLEELWTYSLAHEMVHGSELAFLFNRRRPTSNAIVVGLRTPDSDLEVGPPVFVQNL